MRFAIRRLFRHVAAKQLGPPRLALALMAYAWIFTASAWAASGYVYETAGDVTLGAGKGGNHTVQNNDAIPSDSTVVSGDKSHALLKFKDGLIAAMQANTTLTIKEGSGNSKNAADGNILFSGFSGGAHFISASTGLPNHGSFRLSTPTATIDSSGADFMAATLNNSLYIRVISGSISLTNTAGVVKYSAGQTGLAASPDAPPVTISSADAPTGVFSQIEAIALPTTNAQSMQASISNRTAAQAPIPTTAIKAVHNRDDDPNYFLCDFCTGPTHQPAHIPAKDDPDGPVTGDAAMFGKHNLTPTGANTGEICAFCHTPQGSESTVAAPLWNPSVSTLSSYRAYSTMGSATDEASGSISMACLSCHDGTQAPNIAINTPDNMLDVPKDDVVYIGNDLKNHHPVGMQYGGGGQDQNAPDIPLDPIAAYNQLQFFNQFATRDGNTFSPFSNTFRIFRRRGILSGRDIAAKEDVGNFSNAGNFASPKGGFNKSTYSGTGNGTVWWIETANSKKGRQKTDLYLFTRTDKVDSIPSESTLNRPYVECATCHDPHSTNPTFLRLPGGNTRSQICLTCHNK